MQTFARRLLTENDGQDLIEYALLAALIALAVTGAMSALSTGIGNEFNTITSTLAS